MGWARAAADGAGWRLASIAASWAVIRSLDTKIVFSTPEADKNVTASPSGLSRSALSGKFAANSSA
jgi:hypothetical protein